MENGCVWDLFGIGFMAGLALAVPVGPMAIMLINTTISRGIRHGAIGAFGMASVDGLYAFTVFVVGGLVTSVLSGTKVWFGVAGAMILLWLGFQTIRKNVRLLKTADENPATSAVGGSIAKTYLTFVGATVVNPPTAIYFLAIAPNVANLGYSLSGLNVAVFSIAVLVGSLVWQEALVLTGQTIRSITTNRVRAWIGLLGGTLIVALAISIAVRAMWS